MVPNGWYGGFPNALSHVMVQDYIAKYGGTASAINADVAESYSAAEVLQAAVEAHRRHGPVQLIHWLHSNTVQTVLGPVAFDNDGENTDALQSATIFQWQPGRGGTGRQVRPGPARATAHGPQHQADLERLSIAPTRRNGARNWYGTLLFEAIIDGVLGVGSMA